MAPRRTLAEELAELATPRPAAGKLESMLLAVADPPRRHLLSAKHWLQGRILKVTTWRTGLLWKLKTWTLTKTSSPPGTLPANQRKVQFVSSTSTLVHFQSCHRQVTGSEGTVRLRLYGSSTSLHHICIASKRCGIQASACCCQL